MRSHRRQRAIIRILLGIFLIGLNFSLIPLRRFGVPRIPLAIAAILLTTFGLLSYFQGCFRLARAKGYDDSIMLAVMIVTVFCCPGLMLLALPLILAFFLKDKTRAHSRHY
jgi:hypothetical protein